MIKSLTLRNFQSHKDTYLEFHPGLNVIIGETDSGKTAIIRAWKWLTRNRPSGNEFRSTWGGDTEVIAAMEGNVISRLRTKSDNQYQLNDTLFEAVKTDVPDEIIQVLNVNEINLQQQLDSPFLLSKSPGAVAEHFNKVAHLDQIDTGLKNVQSWIRSLEQDTKSDQKRVQELQEELHQFDHLEKMEVEIEVLEQLEQDFITKSNQKSRLVDIAKELNQILEAKEALQQTISIEVMLTPILEAMLLKRDKKQEKENLIILLNDIDCVQEDIYDLNIIAGLSTEVDSLLSLYDQEQELADKLDNLNSLYSEMADTALYYDELVTKLEAWETTFHDEMPTICPLCGK